MYAKRMLSFLLSLMLFFSACSALAEAVTFDDLIIEDVEEDEELSEEEAEALSDFDMTSSQAEAVEEIELEIDEEIDPSNLHLNTNLPDHIINILLIGVDTRSKDLDNGLQHNDVNIIVSINTETGDIKMTSLLRDIYLPVVGLRNQTRLNNAYARGGAQMSMATINENFELNIQHYVVVNFYGLASIIDGIGGIDIELTKKEAIAINAYLKKNPPKYDNKERGSRVALKRQAGVQHLDGVQAVMYARLREIDNDFARTARQRNLMTLLLKQVLQDLTVDSLIDLMEAALPYVKTNLNASTIMNLALGLLNSGIISKASGSNEDLIAQFRIPMDGAYSYQTKSGMSVVYMGPKNNFPKNVKALHEFIYGEYIPAPEK